MNKFELHLPSWWLSTKRITKA